MQILARRRAAHAADQQGSKGPRETENLTLDDSTVGLPWSLDSAADSPPLLAIDGDGDTAWRGAPDKTLWVYNLPLQRAVHLSLIRSYFGDSSKSGVPSVYHWEYRPALNGACRADANWQLVSGSAVDDRDPNQFVSGPKDIHVRRQALFTDADACALRLVVTTSEGGPPVVRDLRVLEGARSLTRDPGCGYSQRRESPSWHALPFAGRSTENTRPSGPGELGKSGGLCASSSPRFG